MITKDIVRRAADILRDQSGAGPILGFSFDTKGSGVTVDYDERRDVAGLCMDALAEALNQAQNEGSPQAHLHVLQGGM